MSRSIKKTPILSFCGTKAQKKFKVSEHQAERTNVKIKLAVAQYDSLPHPKEYGNEWASPRDGKVYHKKSDYQDGDWAEDYKKWMRK